MKKFFRYLKECRLEMKKVAWPNRATILSSTKLVLITTIIFAILLGLVDFLLMRLIYLIF
ncbi:MAG: preprotein translocase subunit SecE [Spirochaetales bacterium]|nr:preprotein translocase subunit SecE [Spirochaetales bacterium]MBQ3696748.1 preprotein translocase subunit SecE [Spirochaetales bacterium]MBQ3728124.1 preprotein translocase subunit SecE [Spirochaetales bacterium]MBQ3829970.1 preprotein translocase subunit SecE [Spirochaetales bacterium]MBQ4281180.1 preprotein translocase subunit SecE [Spirochaetales bacterium]